MNWLQPHNWPLLTVAFLIAALPGLVTFFLRPKSVVTAYIIGTSAAALLLILAYAAHAYCSYDDWIGGRCEGGFPLFSLYGRGFLPPLIVSLVLWALAFRHVSNCRRQTFGNH